MSNQDESLILYEVLKELVLPFLVGLTSYLLVAKIDEWKSRKKHSRLGVAIMASLIEEVKTGISILNHFETSKELPILFIPNKSWYGNATVNDDVLLRIIEVDKVIKYKHFPPSEIRIHCKNYFEMMASQWNNNIMSLEKNTPPLNVIAQAQGMLTKGEYLKAAISVLAMLERTKELLKDNAKKVIPG
jgi:hypothetical protein